MARSKRPKIKTRPRTGGSRSWLLNALRQESYAHQRTTYSMTLSHGLLFDLARAAAYCQSRSVTWRGIRFPVRYSWWLTVLDPETKKPLISVPGGIIL